MNVEERAIVRANYLEALTLDNRFREFIIEPLLRLEAEHIARTRNPELPDSSVRFSLGFLECINNFEELFNSAMRKKDSVIRKMSK